MKDHDHTNDPKLPFESRKSTQSHSKLSSKEIHQQRSHQDNLPQKYKNRYIEEDIFDGLSGAFSRGVAGVKATFDRMIDHSKAVLAAMGVQIATFFVPSKIDLTMGFTFLTTYLGFIMLFPSRPNRFALGVGVIAGLLMILSGLWPLAAIIAGLAAAISGIRDSNIPNKAFWFTIPFSLLLIVASVAWNDQSIWGIIPTPTLAGLSATTLFGLFAPKNIRRKFSYFFMSESEKLTYQEEEKEIQAALKASEEANLLKAQKAQKYALFGRHIELLEKIEVQVTKLPDDLADQVVEIGISSVNIIKAMESDPRDVLIGGRFLNRYLPIIHENLTKYITVAQYAPLETKEELHKDISKSVNTLQQAFEQLAFELVENDLHDLKIDMNVIDTLVRSQGFEIKK